jgi:NAD(P)-dependent dehydrogenase (short-subunit alcohol dehydrogenase family)
VARKFHKEGYNVALLARTYPGTIVPLADELTSKGAVAKAFQCDSGDEAQVQAVVKQILEDKEFNPGARIDMLCYNVGPGLFKPFADTTAAELESCLRGGPMGLFHFAKAVAPVMEKQSSGGSIGVTGATASWRCMAAFTAFAPSKFAVRALAQGLARDLGPKNIHVFHVIIDGIVHMPKCTAKLPNKPVPEFLQPDSIAETYWHLSQQHPSTWTTEINLAPSPVMKDMATI